MADTRGMDVKDRKNFGGRVSVRGRGDGRSFRGNGQNNRGISRGFRGGGARGFNDRGGGRGRSFRGAGHRGRGLVNRGRSFRGGGRRGLGDRDGGRSFRGGGRGFRGGNSKLRIHEKPIFEDRPLDSENEDGTSSCSNDDDDDNDSIVEELMRLGPKEDSGDEDADTDIGNKGDLVCSEPEIGNGVGRERGSRIARVDQRKVRNGKRKAEESETSISKKKTKYDLTIPLNKQLYYLGEIQKEIKKGFQSDEHRDRFVTNVLEEVEKELPELLLHNEGSEQLKDIIPITTSETIKPLQQVLLDNISNICSDGIGSNIFTAVLQKTFELCDKEKCESSTEVSPQKERQQFSTHWIEAITNHAIGNLEDFIKKQPTNELLTILLVGLSGCHVVFGNIKDVVNPQFEVKKVPKHFQKHLKRIVKTVIHLELENWSDFLSDQLSSKTVTQLLVILFNCNKELCSELIEALNVKFFQDLQPESQLPSALDSRWASRIMTMMIFCSSPSTFDCLLKNSFKPHIQRMAKDRHAKYLVQKLLFKCINPEQIVLIFDEIEPIFNELEHDCVTSSTDFHHSILRKLAHGCSRHRVKENQFCQALMSYLKCSEEAVFQSLASFQTKPDSNSNRVAIGLSIAADLFHFSQPRQIVESMLKTDQAFLVNIIRKKRGLEIVKAFVNNQAIGAEDRTRFVNVLKGAFLTLSFSGCARKCLSIIWGAASIPDKKMIAEELLSGSSPCHHDTYKEFRLDGFKFNPDVWEAVQRAHMIK